MAKEKFWLKTALILTLAAPVSLEADEAADRSALQNIRKVYQEAVKTDNVEELFPHLSETFTAVTPTGQEVKGPKELEAFFQKIWGMIGKGGNYEVNVNVTKTDIYGDLAVSYGTTEEYVKTDGGKEYKFPMLWTAVMQKQNGQWKALRLHGSIDPLNNVFVRAELRTTKYIFGLGGAVPGFALAWLLFRLRAKS